MGSFDDFPPREVALVAIVGKPLPVPRLDLRAWVLKAEEFEVERPERFGDARKGESMFLDVEHQIAKA